MRSSGNVFVDDLKIVVIIEFVARKDAELVAGFEKSDRHHKSARERVSVRLSE